MSLHPIKSAGHAEKYFEQDGGYFTEDRADDGSVYVCEVFADGIPPT